MKSLERNGYHLVRYWIHRDDGTCWSSEDREYAIRQARKDAYHACAVMSGSPKMPSPRDIGHCSPEYFDLVDRAIQSVRPTIPDRSKIKRLIGRRKDVHTGSVAAALRVRGYAAALTTYHQKPMLTIGGVPW